MMLSWKVDPEARKICWRTLIDAPREMVADHSFSLLLDLGSSNGAFGRLVSEGRDARIVGVDISRAVPPAERVEFVQADILHLPFKDESFDLVSARAILHHVPHDLERAIGEATRVLLRGCLFLCQEPTADNLLSTLARRFFKTTRHEPSEEPLSFVRLKRAISESLTILDVRHHFVLTYLLPHIVSRFKGFARRVLLGLSELFVQMDERLISKRSFWRRRAAYVTISAQKEEADPRSP